MNREELAYIAGVMDSDGYFSIRKSSYNIRVIKDSKKPIFYERVGIKQVQNEAINLIFNNFGGNYRIEKPTAKKGKPLYCLQITNLKAHNFIKFIYPFLRIKKRQAELLLQLRKSLSKGKTELFMTNQKNRWGKIIQTKKYRISDEDIEFRESLLAQIKKLNDSRSGGAFTPKPY